MNIYVIEIKLNKNNIQSIKNIFTKLLGRKYIIFAPGVQVHIQVGRDNSYVSGEISEY